MPHLFLSTFTGCPLKSIVEEKALTRNVKAYNGISPSQLAELLKDLSVRVLRSPDSPTSSIPFFDLKSAGDSSWALQDPLRRIAI